MADDDESILGSLRKGPCQTLDLTQIFEGLHDKCDAHPTNSGNSTGTAMAETAWFERMPNIPRSIDYIPTVAADRDRCQSGTQQDSAIDLAVRALARRFDADCHEVIQAR
jgi:hypothetical protein